MLASTATIIPVDIIPIPVRPWLGKVVLPLTENVDVCIPISELMVNWDPDKNETTPT